MGLSLNCFYKLLKMIDFSSFEHLFLQYQNLSYITLLRIIKQIIMNIIQQIKENRERYYDHLYREYVKANDSGGEAIFEEKSSERQAQVASHKVSRKEAVRETTVFNNIRDAINDFFNTEETPEFELEADRRIVG